jgi:hypothetical protein
MAMDIQGQEPHHKRNLARAAVSGQGKRNKLEGAELEITERFRPEMINHEVYVVGGYGGQINGAYHTTRVTHKMMSEWTTTAMGVKP